MKRLLFVIDSLGRGGAERGLVGLLWSLDRSQFEVELLTIFADGALSGEVPPWVRRSSLLPGDEKHPRWRWVINAFRRRIVGRALRSEIERDGAKRRLAKVAPGPYDAVVAFLEGMSTYLVSASNIPTERRVAWVHMDMTQQSTGFFGARIPERVYGAFDAVGVVSSAALGSFRRCVSVDYQPAEQKVLPMPVDAERVRRLAAEPASLSGSGLLAVVVGRLAREKRVDRAIRAHAVLLGRGLRHRLAIIGDGPERSKLVALARELGVGDSVQFLGGMKNPYPYMRMADLVVLPSDYEGLSLVVAEAMTLARPILSTATAGPPALLAQGKYGRLCPVDDAAFESAMEEMLTDAGARDEYVRRIREDADALPISRDYGAIIEFIQGA